MNIKEYLEKIFVACTYYDKEITGKLGTEGEYEGSYEQAIDIVLNELDNRIPKEKILELARELEDEQDKEDEELSNKGLDLGLRNYIPTKSEVADKLRKLLNKE